MRGSLHGRGRGNCVRVICDDSDESKYPALRRPPEEHLKTPADNTITR